MSIFTNSSARSREEAAEYTRAILGLLGTRDPLTVLGDTSAALRRLLDGMPDRLTALPEAEGKWSIRQVCRHLADSEIVWGWRMRLVYAQDRPEITGYDQDAWATRLRYAEAPVEESLGDFERLRAINLRLIGRMPVEDRARVGVHAERGHESVEHMMKMYAGHDTLHLRQIERIKAAVAGR